MRILLLFVDFINELVSKRALIVQLVKRDIQNRYLGSGLGFFWAYIHPVLTITVLIVVFQFGLKAQPVSNAPFSLWLISGLIPWFFLSEGLSAGTSAVVEYDYLVKKVAFRTSLLPVVKILSAISVHVAFMGILLLVLYVYAHPIEWPAIQMIYFSVCASIFLVGITWMTSSLAVFLKDVVQLVGAFLGFLFWLTPLCWGSEMIPHSWRWTLYVNPVAYITEGYRNSLVYHQWFWQGDGLYATYFFWLITLCLFVTGALVFRRLRPHFADVL
jgi:lipopolysaccharide transport system permease protein